MLILKTFVKDSLVHFWFDRLDENFPYLIMIENFSIKQEKNVYTRKNGSN